ncbi:Mitochondrial carrier protein ymc2 [Microbotryomycetes sp. JL221]|nr:Mitochondrial carrier protein ymc2 [Microbotryomycetes sp. JL221]
MDNNHNESTLVLKELLAGTFGGIGQVLSGQPFDMVKVRLQSSNTYSGALECASSILKQEGPLAFYKGTAMPLVGIGACVSLQFAFLQAAKRHFERSNLTKSTTGLTPDQLSPTQLYASGAIAGLGNSVVSGPVEHVRIRLQTQKPTSDGKLLYSGPLDALKKIHKTDGVRGIYHGQMTTIARYFAIYEALVASKIQKSNLKRKDLPLTNAAGFGALAGVGMWLLNYPLDVIKSRLQTDGLPSQSGTSSKRYSGAIDCTKQLYQEQGFKGFFRGLSPTLARAPIVNAVTFVVFEMTMKLIA